MQRYFGKLDYAESAEGLEKRRLELTQYKDYLSKELVTLIEELAVSRGFNLDDYTVRAKKNMDDEARHAALIHQNNIKKLEACLK